MEISHLGMSQMCGKVRLQGRYEIWGFVNLEYTNIVLGGNVKYFAVDFKILGTPFKSQSSLETNHSFVLL